MSGRAGDVFSSTYAQARIRFLAAARDAGLKVESKLHPLKGRDGEDLAIDVALDGDVDARNLLILSSACHGVEGFCGSGVQLASLLDPRWREHAHDKGIAVLYVHALNPHGFSHLRRVTHENVDLNRNFHDFSKPLPVNQAYRELHHLLLPDEWPPTDSNKAAIQEYIVRNGEAAFKAAVSGGQHEFPTGLFFGGTAPTWSNLTLRELLRAYGHRAARIGWIDIHTGLGPSGVGERIYAGRDEQASIARAQAWWAGNGATPLTSIYDGSSTSAFLTGMMWSSIHEECPQAEYTGMALEYGTLPSAEVIEALRADHWVHLHPDAPATLAARIRQQVKEAFFTDTDEWKAQVLRQAREALFQAADGLAS
jgi:hypothetical protein